MIASEQLLQLKNNSFWRKHHSPIWVGSSFLLRRNLADDRFPCTLNDEESVKIVNVLKESLLTLKTLHNPFFLDFTHMKPVEKEFLSERFLITFNHKRFERPSGCVLDTNGALLVLMNREDHLTLYSIGSDLEWKIVWNALSHIEQSLGKQHSFAYSNRFGYLTSNLSHLGTAFIAQAFLHLPCLTGWSQMRRDFSKWLDRDIAAQGLFGGYDFSGHLMMIRNRLTLGLSEDNILKDVHQMATQLVSQEKECRLKLKSKPDPLMIDAMSRSIGLLKHAYQIDWKEALNAISLIKLGLDIGWIQGITQESIDPLFFELGQGHLTIHTQENLSQKEVLQKRAECLKLWLKPIAMCI